MDFTKEKYQRASKKFEDYVANNEDDLVEAMSLRMEEEALLVVDPRNSNCINQGKDYSKFMESPGVNIEGLKKLGRNYYFNLDIMKVTGCALESVFARKPFDSKYSNIPARGKADISNLRQIGSSSASGIAILGDYRDQDSFFVVKAPIRGGDVDANEEMVHEIFVGLYGLNPLRKHIPNFAYVYGGFGCSSPMIDSNTREVVTWCNDNNEKKTQYMLMENISTKNELTGDSKGALVDLCKKGSLIEFASAFLQIVCSLIFANRAVNFTHYDLHHENILIRDPGENYRDPFQIRYRVSATKEIYVKAVNIATIIDYGRSFVSLKTDQGRRGYGIPDLNYFSRDMTFPNMHWFLHDTYKLTCFCGLDSMNVNKPVYDLMEKVFKFFAKTTKFEDAINNQFDQSRYSIAPTEETTKYNNYDLLRHMLKIKEFRNLASDRPLEKYKIFSCMDKCINYQTIVEKTGSPNKTPVVNNLTDYARVMENNERNYNEGYDSSMRSFDYPSMEANHTKLVDATYKELTDTIKKVRVYDIKDDINLESLTVMDVIRQTHTNVFKAVALYEKLEIYIKDGEEVSIEFRKVIDTTPMVTKYNNMTVYTEIIKNEILALINKTADEYQKLVLLSNSPAWKGKLGKRKSLRWYRNEAWRILSLRDSFK